MHVCISIFAQLVYENQAFFLDLIQASTISITSLQVKGLSFQSEQLNEKSSILASSILRTIINPSISSNVRQPLRCQSISLISLTICLILKVCWLSSKFRISLINFLQGIYYVSTLFESILLMISMRESISYPLQKFSKILLISFCSRYTSVFQSRVFPSNIFSSSQQEQPYFSLRYLLMFLRRPSQTVLYSPQQQLYSHSSSRSARKRMKIFFYWLLAQQLIASRKLLSLSSAISILPNLRRKQVLRQLSRFDFLPLIFSYFCLDYRIWIIVYSHCLEDIIFD